MSRAKKRLNYFKCKNFKFIRKGLYTTYQSCTAFTSYKGCWKDCKIASGKAIKCAFFETKDKV